MATLAETRLKACRLWPYGSSAILSLVPVESQAVDTMAVDKHWRLYYRSSELAKLTVEQAAGTILHEVSHLLLKHHKRAETIVPAGGDKADWKRWNTAADLAVNSGLAEEGVTLPDGSLFPKQYEFEAGQSAEAYYRALEEQEKASEQEQPREAQQDRTQPSQPSQEPDAGDQGDQPDEHAEDQAGKPDASDDGAQDGEQDQKGDQTNEQGDAGQDYAEQSDAGQGDGQPGDQPGGQPGDQAGQERSQNSQNSASEPDHDDCGNNGSASVQPGGQLGHQDGTSDPATGGSPGSDSAGEPSVGADDPSSAGQGGSCEGGEPCEADDEPLPGGSCADGQQRPWEQGPPSDEEPGIKPHEADMIVRKVAEQIHDKQRGTGRGGWKVWAESIIDPKIDPRAKLLRAVRRAVEFTSGTGDYSYRRPNRRNPRPDIVLPSAVQPVPRITVIVDTSGSMDKQDLGMSLGLIGKVLNGFRIRDGIKVICGDTAVQSAGRVFSPKQVELAGGGGTSIDVLIVAAVQSKPRPDLIVVCSDGFTPWPAAPVGVPVVACITRECSLANVPAWIDTVSLE
ncbi:MAG TPA: VWA-like domain-containing protein [Pirellulales bacterium]|nr:VWA-like domain-containing protein [Pirellulales bacterium]